MLERQLAYRTIAAAELMEHGAYYFWAVTTVVLGAGVWGLASAVVVRSLVGTCAFLAFSPAGRVRPRLAWRPVRNLIGFGLRFQAVGLVGMIRDQGINVGTAAIAGLATLGQWSFVYGLLQGPLLLFETLWRVSFPAMARLLAVGDDPSRSFQRALNVLGIVSGLIVAGMAGTAPALVPAVFGAKWLPSVAVMPWANLAFAFAGPISVVSAGYLYARGDSTAVLKAVCVSAAVWVAVGLGLLPLIGVSAIGVGMFASAVAESWMLGAALKRRTQIHLARALLPSSAAAGVASAAGWFTAEALGRTLWSTGASGVSVVVAYVAVLILADRHALTEACAVLRRHLGRSPDAPEPSVLGDA